MDVRQHFLRDLKEQDLLKIKHLPGDDNDADIFTKNVTQAIFNKHVKTYVGVDAYADMSGDG